MSLSVTVQDGEVFNGLGKNDVVIKAFYGHAPAGQVGGSSDLNVLAKIKFLLEPNAPPFTVNDVSMKGDPCPGKPKRLYIEYKTTSRDEIKAEKKKGTMHEREAKHKPTLFETLTAWFTIVICIVSMGLAINTYMLMLTAAAEVGDIVTNWETVPVTDMTIPAAGTSCPSGYDDNSNFFNLPSNGDSNCGCPIGATHDGDSYSSSSSGCNSNQTSAGCGDTDRIASTNFNQWRGSKLCVKRGGEPVYSPSKDPSVRPEPYDVKGIWTCPTLYHRCGPSSNDGSRSVCVPDTVTGCPVTFAASEYTYSVFYPAYVSASSQSPLNRSTMDGSATSYPAIEGFTYLPTQWGAATTYSGEVRLDRETSDSWNTTTSKLGKVLNGVGALPVVEITVAVRKGGGESAGGPCYGRATAVFGNREEFDDTTVDYGSATAVGKIGEPSACEEDDPRWKVVEIHNARNMILENLLKSPKCVGLTQTQAIASDYFTSGTRCTTGFGNGPLDCLASSQTKACSSTDTRCKMAFYQSNCGSVMMYRNGVATDSTLAIYVRHQIYWKTGCGLPSNKQSEAEGSESAVDGEVTQEGVADIIKPLDDAVLAQLWLLWINVIANICIIVFSCCTLSLYYDTCCKHCNKVTKDKCFPKGADTEDYEIFHSVIERRNILLKVCKVVPLVFCIMYVERIMEFFINIASQNCSDDTTNKSFQTLAKMLPEAMASNASTLALDALAIVYFAYNYFFGKSSDEDEEEEEEGKNGGFKAAATTEEEADLEGTLGTDIGSIDALVVTEQPGRGQGGVELTKLTKLGVVQGGGGNERIEGEWPEGNPEYWADQAYTLRGPLEWYDNVLAIKNPAAAKALFLQYKADKEKNPFK